MTKGKDDKEKQGAASELDREAERALEELVSGTAAAEAPGDQAAKVAAARVEPAKPPAGPQPLKWDRNKFPQPEKDEPPPPTDEARRVREQLSSISPYRDGYQPAAGTPIVEFHNVTKSFGEGPDAFTAIKDVNFQVLDKPGKGEFVCVLGPSGCGKSTVLRLIAGLAPHHPATTGTVKVDGRSITGPGADRGMVFQDYTSFDHRTVEANVAFGLECRGDPRDQRRKLARDWISKVGLSVEHDAGKYPHELSGGMRQRVAIARTLVLKPRIILMDEPFGALDPSTRLKMQDLLVSLWRELEATVFFVTHSIEEAVFLGDRIYVLSSSPGTILEEIRVPPPNWPAKDMQKHPEFLEYVFHIRDVIEELESSKRAGDD